MSEGVSLTTTPSTHTNILQRANNNLPIPLTIYSSIYLLAGASARMTGATLTSPLDALKARVQFSQRNPEVYQFTSTKDVAKHMLFKEGLTSFYRGLPARLVYIGPASAISFLFYEQFRHLFHKPKSSSSDYFQAVLPLAAAGVFRVIGTCLRTPFDVTRQRMQVMGGLKAYSEVSTKTKNMQQSNNKNKDTRPHRGVHRNSYQAFRSIIQTEGIRGLFAGVGITILRDIPFAIVYFLAYESVKTAQQLAMDEYDNNNNKIGPINHMIAGSIAAACSVFISNPLDVIKTRLQTQGALSSPKYKTIYSCIKSVIADDGYRGFMRGLVPRMFYLCPSAAITFSLYEQFKHLYSTIWDIDPSTIQKSTKKLAS